MTDVPTGDRIRALIHDLEDPNNKCADSVTSQEFLKIYNTFVNDIEPYSERKFTGEQVSDLFVRLAPLAATPLVLIAQKEARPLHEYPCIHVFMQ